MSLLAADVCVPGPLAGINGDPPFCCSTPLQTRLRCSNGFLRGDSLRNLSFCFPMYGFHKSPLLSKQNAQLGPAGPASLVHFEGWGSAATAGSCTWTISFLTAYSTSSTME